MITPSAQPPMGAALEDRSAATSPAASAGTWRVEAIMARNCATALSSSSKVPCATIFP